MLDILAHTTAWPVADPEFRVTWELALSCGRMMQGVDLNICFDFAMQILKHLRVTV
jgi:hypothetical protein